MDRTLSKFLETLLTRSSLSSAAQEALLAIRGRQERLEPRQSIAQIGENLSSVCVILDGLCARVELPTDERRQITAFYVPGDIPNLYSAFAPQAASTIEAITSVVVTRLAPNELHKLMAAYPAIIVAFATYLVADEAITSKWLTNLGGRSALTTVSHLYCEMASRLCGVDGNQFSFPFPITQVQLAEACGISAVHANRTMRALRRSKTLLIERSVAHVMDWRALKVMGRFDDFYLASKQPAYAKPL